MEACTANSEHHYGHNSKKNYSTFVHPDYCVLQDFMKLAVMKWLVLKDQDINNYRQKEVWVRIGQFVAGRDDFVGFFLG